MQMDAIILDGDQRSALAATRSLGRRGMAVAVGAESDRSLAACSRYSRDRFHYPSPYRDPDSFFNCIGDYAARHRGAVLFPMTDVTVGELLRRRHELQEMVTLPFVDFERYAAASDKANLLAIAETLGVPTPQTIFAGNDNTDIDGIVAGATKIGYPLVIKPSMSRIRTRNGWIQAGVRYAEDCEALRQELEREACRSVPLLIQERIEGPGIGIFLLLHRGEIVAKFAHRRIREKPPSGGVGVLCEGIEAPVEALDSATKLLQKFDWTGVAMVEFKLDRRDRRFKLMEINGRFWGSLQLAISSGVDFPYLLFQLAAGEKIDPPRGYDVGLRSRWELGDLDHLFLRLRKTPSELALPADAPSRGKVLKEFASAFIDPSIHHEVFRWSDPGPFFFEAQHYLSDLI